MEQHKYATISAPQLIHRVPKEGTSSLAVEGPPLFSGLLPFQYAKIAALARIREFERAEILYLEREPVEQVLLLTSGLVKLTKFGVSGTEVILRLSGPGDVLGMDFPLCGSRHGTTAQAFRLCRALVWDAPVFKAQIEPFPFLQQNLTRILSQHLVELEERFRELATERVGPRVAHQVVRLAEQIGTRGEDGVEISVSREELAQMTGTTLFTVSRQLSAWEALGIVKPRREAVFISDLNALRVISREN